jgi:hypothetical protein
MIFSEKGRGAPFLRKNHPLNQQCLNVILVCHPNVHDLSDSWLQFNLISTAKAPPVGGASTSNR